MKLAKLKEINDILQNLNEDQETSLDFMLTKGGFTIEEAATLLVEMKGKGYTGLKATKFTLTPEGKEMAQSLSSSNSSE